MKKLIALAVIFTLFVVAPSPIKKTTPLTFANSINASQTHTEATQSISKENSTNTQPQAQTAVADAPKPFDVNDKSTWPTCPDNQWVWAQDGQCHDKPVAAPQEAVAAATPSISYSSDHNTLMAQAGIAASDYAAVDYIVSHESGWRWWVKNNEGSGATGLCQALPGSKMASAGADWATNPVTQLRWCTSYAVGRYGSWWGAYNFWVNNHWW